MGRLKANYNSSKNNKISIKKQNLGGGRLLLNYIFDPKEIQGLSLWLKSDAGVVIDPQLAAKVIGWVDQSNNGNNATAAGVYRPTFIDNDQALNNSPSISFNGTTNSFVIPSINFDMNTNNSVFIAFYATNASTSALLSQGGIGNYIIAATSNKLNISNSNVQTIILAGDVPNLSAAIVSSTNDANTFTLYKNGIQVGNTTFYDGFSFNGTKMFIGGDSASLNPSQATSFFLSGSIAEILIYNRAVTTTERKKVETYLQGKYAPTCGYQNINKLAQIDGIDAPIGRNFNKISFDYGEFASDCLSLGLDPATILNNLGKVDFSSNFVVTRAKTTSSISADSISQSSSNIIITTSGNVQNVPKNYYRFFVMCKNGWNLVTFYGAYHWL